MQKTSYYIYYDVMDRFAKINSAVDNKTESSYPDPPSVCLATSRRVPQQVMRNGTYNGAESSCCLSKVGDKERKEMSWRYAIVYSTIVLVVYQ